MQAAALQMTRAQVGQLEGERDGAVAQFDDEREGRLLLQSRLTGLMVHTAELQKINAVGLAFPWANMSQYEDDGTNMIQREPI